MSSFDNLDSLLADPGQSAPEKVGEKIVPIDSKGHLSNLGDLLSDPQSHKDSLEESLAGIRNSDDVVGALKKHQAQFGYKRTPELINALGDALYKNQKNPKPTDWGAVATATGQGLKEFGSGVGSVIKDVVQSVNPAATDLERGKARAELATIPNSAAQQSIDTLKNLSRAYDEHVSDPILGTDDIHRVHQKIFTILDQADEERKQAAINRGEDSVGYGNIPGFNALPAVTTSFMDKLKQTDAFKNATPEEQQKMMVDPNVGGSAGSLLNLPALAIAGPAGELGGAALGAGGRVAANVVGRGLQKVAPVMVRAAETGGAAGALGEIASKAGSKLDLVGNKALKYAPLAVFWHPSVAAKGLVGGLAVKAGAAGLKGVGEVLQREGGTVQNVVNKGLGVAGNVAKGAAQGAAGGASGAAALAAANPNFDLMSPEEQAQFIATGGIMGAAGGLKGAFPKVKVQGQPNIEPPASGNAPAEQPKPTGPSSEQPPAVEPVKPVTPKDPQVAADAVKALRRLGYSATDAKNAVAKVTDYTDASDLTNKALGGKGNTSEAGIPATVTTVTPVEATSAEVKSETPATWKSPVQYVKTNLLKLSPDVPNFKEGADPKTGVVGRDRLKGEVNEKAFGAIQVWERLNGALQVISGRHRLDLANQNGLETVPVQIVREADGFTKEKALAADAELNILEGQGQIKDYAKYFRNNQGLQESQAASRGLLSRTKGRAGWALGKAAGDDLYAAYSAGVVPEAKAVAIAESAPGDAGLQRAGLKNAKRLTADELPVFLKSLSASRGPTETTGDLFGADDSAIKESIRIAKEATKRANEIGEQITSASGAAKNPKAAAKLGVDVNDPEALATKLQELKTQRELYRNLDPSIMGELKESKPTPLADAVKGRANGESAFVDLTPLHEFGASIYDGVKDFATWSKEMIGKFGDKVSEHLQEIWDNVKDTASKVHDTYKNSRFSSEVGAVGNLSPGFIKSLGIHDNLPAQHVVGQFKDGFNGVSNPAQYTERMNKNLVGLRSEIKDGKYLNTGINERPYEAQQGRKLTDSEKKQMLSDMHAKQKEIQNGWVDYLATGGYSPEVQHLILSTITREVATPTADGGWKTLKLGKDADRLPDPASPGLAAGVAEALTNPENKGKRISQIIAEVAAKQAEERLGQKQQVATDTEGGGKLTWVKFPSKAEDPKNFKNNVQDLTSLAKTSSKFGKCDWCTGNGAAQGQLEQGSFWIGKDETGNARTAIRMEGDSIGEIRGVLEGQNLEPKYAQNVQELVKKERMEGGHEFLHDANIKGSLQQFENGELTLDELRKNLPTFIEHIGYGSPRVYDFSKDKNLDEGDLVRVLTDHVSPGYSRVALEFGPKFTDVITRNVGTLSANKKVLIAASQTNKELLRKLYESKDTTVAEALAGNVNTPKDILTEMAGSPLAGVTYKVASNESTPPETLGKLTRSWSDETAMRAAGNKNTPVKAISDYYELNKLNPTSVSLVAANTSSTPDILGEIFKDYRYGNRGVEVAHGEYQETMRRLAGNTSTPPTVLGNLYRYGNRGVGVAHGEYQETMRRLAGNTSTPPTVLGNLLGISDALTTRRVALNTSTPTDTLQFILKWSDSFSKEKAAEQLKARGVTP